MKKLELMSIVNNKSISIIINGHKDSNKEPFQYLSSRDNDELSEEVFELINEYNSIIEINVGDHRVIHYDLTTALDIASRIIVYPVADGIEKPLIICE